ncbi:MAG: hypothetical protein WC055_08435 [Melioribacteraceae bacterium]
MILSIKEFILHGVRIVFHNSKFVILLWAINAISAVVLTVPIYQLLIDSLGQSLYSDKLAVDFDLMWFAQFQNIYKIHIEQIPLNIYFVVGIYTLIQTFFLGGLISVFHQPQKNHMVDFFFGGVKYFYRFVKILVATLFLYVAAFIINDFAGDLIGWTYSNSESVMGDFVIRSLRYILLIFFIGVISIIADYSKVSLGVKDSNTVFKEIYSAILFIKKNFFKVFAIFLIIAILGALGAVFYNLLNRFIPRTPYYYLVITFILQQMLIIFRLYIRMLFCATEVSLFKDLSAEVETGNIINN